MFKFHYENLNACNFEVLKGVVEKNFHFLHLKYMFSFAVTDQFPFFPFTTFFPCPGLQ